MLEMNLHSLHEDTLRYLRKSAVARIVAAMGSRYRNGQKLLTDNIEAPIRKVALELEAIMLEERRRALGKPIGWPITGSHGNRGKQGRGAGTDAKIQRRGINRHGNG
jgi:hypothetical protein